MRQPSHYTILAHLFMSFTWITTHYEKLNINLNDNSQHLSVLCVFSILNNEDSLNSINNIKQKRKSTILILLQPVL